MDDIKLFAKKEKELEILIHAVGIYSQDIGMKCGKRHMIEGKHWNARRKENVQILRNIGS